MGRNVKLEHRRVKRWRDKKFYGVLPWNVSGVKFKLRRIKFSENQLLIPAILPVVYFKSFREARSAGAEVFPRYVTAWLRADVSDYYAARNYYGVWYYICIRSTRAIQRDEAPPAADRRGLTTRVNTHPRSTRNVDNYNPLQPFALECFSLGIFNSSCRDAEDVCWKQFNHSSRMNEETKLSYLNISISNFMIWLYQMKWWLRLTPQRIKDTQENMNKYSQHYNISQLSIKFTDCRICKWKGKLWYISTISM